MGFYNYHVDVFLFLLPVGNKVWEFLSSMFYGIVKYTGSYCPSAIPLNMALFSPIKTSWCTTTSSTKSSSSLTYISSTHGRRILLSTLDIHLWEVSLLKIIHFASKGNFFTLHLISIRSMLAHEL